MPSPFDAVAKDALRVVAWELDCTGAIQLRGTMERGEEADIVQRKEENDEDSEIDRGKGVGVGDVASDLPVDAFDALGSGLAECIDRKAERINVVGVVHYGGSILPFRQYVREPAT